MTAEENERNMNENNHHPNNQQQLRIPPRLALTDLNHYVQTNGIHDDSTTYRQRADVYYAVASEELSRARQAQEYQDAIHKSLFREDSDEETLKKKAFLEECIPDDTVIDIQTADGVVEGVPLPPLVMECDTVYALVRSRQLFSEGVVSELALTQFVTAPLNEFLNVLLYRKKVSDISPDLIIETCRLAHFLQSSTVIDDIVSVIEASIDCKNCMSICALADALELHSLFETALSFMLKTFDDMQYHPMWDDIPSNLQNRIFSVRDVLKSSIVARGAKRRKLFFSSTDEFLAIFADNIREQRERLREAKERQDEVVREKKQGQQARSYAESMIQLQEQRILTLETFLNEQKVVFSRSI